METSKASVFTVFRGVGLPKTSRLPLFSAPWAHHDNVQISPHPLMQSIRDERGGGGIHGLSFKLSLLALYRKDRVHELGHGPPRLSQPCKRQGLAQAVSSWQAKHVRSRDPLSTRLYLTTSMCPRSAVPTNFHLVSVPESWSLPNVLKPESAAPAM